MKPPERTSLEALAERWIVEGWQKGRAAIVDELHAPGFLAARGFSPSLTN